VASVPKLELRDFHTVQRDLESVLLKLKSSFNPEVRRSLLRELRLRNWPQGRAFESNATHPWRTQGNR